ncbi:tRNA 5-carboxymethoxyuridine methyltransferase [Pseudoalteromonas sp. CIP111854]|uniref:tRNA 5-carboxymethoxyuridine methyltransferase n=1 Tax=Pseudoalteromonas holothuriae TaxID=2963714 RepID=A0A9W4VRY5_9GAMM|nr:class I SAM-dependent methyltransferase [Pseudoalteromonas sp. CIP111854]CAH9051226.1 tRNA 5-carboxymethoxyuridine methyltransferase [Pseudoalteromonas sp. CIP111854]
MTNSSTSPQWLADEYEQGNDGQFKAALEALDKISDATFPDERKAVDVGCGSGKFAACLAQQGWRVDATDVSESMVEATQKRCIDLPVNAAVCDASKLTLEKNHYDLVTSFWMLHWLVDATPTLKQMADAVKENGYALLQWSCGQPRAQGFVLRDTIQEVFDRPKWSSKLKAAPLTMYQLPIEDVTAFFENNGFEVISVRENVQVGGGETPESLKRALRSAAFAAQTVILGDEVDELIDECLALLMQRNALQVANTELVVKRKR